MDEHGDDVIRPLLETFKGTKLVSLDIYTYKKSLYFPSISRLELRTVTVSAKLIQFNYCVLSTPASVA